MSGRLSLCAAAFAVSVAVSGGAAALAADPPPGAQLPPDARMAFQEYLEVPRSFDYRAFAVEPESGQWGRSLRFIQPGIAIDQAIEYCRRRSARGCQAYAVGDIVVLGLGGWKTEVAITLYRVKSDATNGDLEAVTSPGGGAAVAALRRSVLHAAAKMGNTAAAAAMLDRGVGVDAGSEVGATALSYAASRGHPGTVALLLERGAAVNARNGAGKTALGVALLANNFARLRAYLAADHRAVIRLLADAGGTE